jgi:myo-inositol 2-dehydrogenase/D-chiro-inositol 1-dehydrogenase
VVVGAVDPDPLAQEAARRSGLPACSTIEEGLQLGGEAAIVASPPQEHPDQTIACLRIGMAVLVEKPLALSLEAAVRVAQESTRLGLQVAVAQNFRFLRRERAVRKALAAGVGKPLSATIVSARPPTVAMPHVAAIEHGPLWDICIHHLDALRVRFGAAPETVEMIVKRLGTSPADGRLLFRILLEWQEGPAVVYQHSEGAPGFYHAEWIEGERRAIIVRDQNVSVLFPHHRARPVLAPRAPQPEQAILDDFLGALRSGGVPTLSAQDNLLTVATMEAAVRAEAVGRAVTLAEVGETAGVALGTGRVADG